MVTKYKDPKEYLFGVEQILPKDSIDLLKNITIDERTKDRGKLLASQNLEELVLLREEIEKLSPLHTILEIGVFLGGTLKVWENVLFNKDRGQSLLLGLDIAGRMAWNIDDSLVDSYFVCGDTHVDNTLRIVKKLLGDKQIDFLFIDGDHTYNGVSKDFEMYSPLVRKGGIIALHDILYSEEQEQVNRYWNEIKTQYRYKEIFRESGWAGVGVIYK